MATKCVIAIRDFYKGKIKVKAITCECEGYISWTGRVLFENYDRKELVDELLEHGDLVLLDVASDVCLLTPTYNEAMEFGNLQELLAKYSDYPYIYIYDIGEWKVVKDKYGMTALEDLL